MTLLSFHYRNHPRLGRWMGLAVLVTLAVLLAACDKTGNMVAQPRYNPLAYSSLFPDGRSARPFVPDTVPNYGGQSPNDPALTGLDQNGNPVQAIPVPVDKALVTKGQERFNIYCQICHGPTGQADGMVVATFGFPKPPILTAQNAKSLTAGQIFAIIENGRGKMLPYGYRVKADERWAVIAYIRALQMSGGKPVDPATLTTDQLNQIGKQP